MTNGYAKMNNQTVMVNWQSWHYFVTAAESGTVSKAASTLAISQPTLSRQLVDLEKQLGQALFNRSTQGITLTEFGLILLEEAKLMQCSAFRLQRLVGGHTTALSGRLRLSANELLANYYLPNILPTFLNQYPDISVEIEVTNQASNIDKRDADVAIRMFRPTQIDLVARHLFDIPLGFYASRGYLEKVGTPHSPESLLEHRILGYDRDTQIEQGSQLLGWNLKNEDFKLRCDFMPIQIELARNDGGIVATHCELATKLSLQKIEIGIELPKLPVYLVCHRDVQHNQKIRVMMDYLAKTLTDALK